MDNFEISMNKSVNIACLYLENKIETAYDISRIQLFTENVFTAIADFTKKIIKAIAEFIDKIKKKIHDKINEFMLNHKIKSISKAAQKSISKTVNIKNYYPEDKMRRLLNKSIDVYSKGAMRIVKAYPNEIEMRRIEEEVSREVENISKELGAEIHDYRLGTGDAVKQIRNEEFLAYLERESISAINKIDKEMQKAINYKGYSSFNEKASDKNDKKKKSKKGNDKKAVGIFQKFQMGVSSITQKCAKFCADNRTSLLVGLSVVLGAGAIAMNVAVIKERKEVNKMLKEQEDLIRRARRR